jgi:hypothetical protein
MLSHDLDVIVCIHNKVVIPTVFGKHMQVISSPIFWGNAQVKGVSENHY